MTLATPVTPNNCFRPSAALTTKAPATPWWRRTLPSRVAAGVIAASVLGCAAGIELARAWAAPPHVGAEAEQVVGGVVVALFLTAALGLVMRVSGLERVAVAAIFALVAHGGTLVLEGELVGALFLGVAPVIALLTHATFAVDEAEETTSARDALMRTRLLALWMKTSRRRIAPAAALAASPIPLAMRASQATIIDAWVKTPSSSSPGSATSPSCASTA